MLPAGYEAVTGDEAADDAASDLMEAISVHQHRSC